MCLLVNTITVEPFEISSLNLYGYKTMVKSSDEFGGDVTSLVF